MHPGQQIREIPKIPPRGKLESEHKLDSETLNFVHLFDSRLKEVNDRSFLLKYIRENTIGGVNARVVEDWLIGKVPKVGVCNDIILVLENFRPVPFKEPKILTREQRWQEIMKGVMKN
jgi:hypothetical protein